MPESGPTEPATPAAEPAASEPATPAADPVTDEAALPLYLPAPAAAYTVAADGHRTRPYLAQHTATLGRSATHAGARAIAAHHHQDTGVIEPEPIPFALNSEEAAPLIRLACRVAVEAQRVSDASPGGAPDFYDEALRWVSGNSGFLGGNDLHELALTVADEIHDLDR